MIIYFSDISLKEFEKVAVSAGAIVRALSGRSGNKIVEGGERKASQYLVDGGLRRVKTIIKDIQKNFPNPKRKTIIAPSSQNIRRAKKIDINVDYYPEKQNIFKKS